MPGHTWSCAAADIAWPEGSYQHPELPQSVLVARDLGKCLFEFQSCQLRPADRVGRQLCHAELLEYPGSVRERPRRRSAACRGAAPEALESQSRRGWPKGCWLRAAAAGRGASG